LREIAPLTLAEGVLRDEKGGTSMKHSEPPADRRAEAAAAAENTMVAAHRDL
jgi:hypothetical protein